MNKNFIVDFIMKSIDYSNEKEEMIKAIEAAKLEMEVANLAFQHVENPKLIEATIYSEQAAIARYEYLISQAKEKGIKVDYGYILSKQCIIE